MELGIKPPHCTPHSVKLNNRFSNGRLPQSIILYSLLILLAACDNSIIEPPPEPGQPPEIGTIKFVALGDTGTGSQNQYAVANAIQKTCESQGCDFALLLGDNVYDTGVDGIDDPQFQSKFEEPYRNLNFPFYVVLGNHDYGTAGLIAEKGQHQVIYSDTSDKWRMPHHYYQFTQAHVDFFALDTNAQFWGVDTNQKQKMTAWINASAATWKIVFGHHPYKSNGPHGNAGKYEGIPGVPFISGDHIKDFAENVWCGKADLYLSGHDHSRQWLESTCQGTQLIVSGAGAKTTDLPGTNTALFQADTLGFLYISITGKQLNAAFINTNGDVEFSHTLKK